MSVTVQAWMNLMIVAILVGPFLWAVAAVLYANRHDLAAIHRVRREAEQDRRDAAEQLALVAEINAAARAALTAAEQAKAQHEAQVRRMAVPVRASVVEGN